MSIEINTGSSKSVNWEQILSSIGDVKKADSVEGKEAFTITTNDGGETRSITINIPDDLEIPENVDSGTLQGLVDKLSQTGLNFTDEQIAQMKDSIISAFEEMSSAASEVTSSSKSKKGSAMFNLYALMALMIDVAQSQRDAQREIRTAENLSVQKSIQDQADSQRNAANVGMWLGIACGVASAAASLGVMAAQSVTASQQSKIVSQSGADSAKTHVSMLQNTDSPENASAQLNKTTLKVGNDVANRVTQDFEAKLSGDGNNGNLKTALDNAINNNETAKTEVTQKEQTLATERNTLTQKEDAKNAAQDNVNAKTATVTEKQTAYDNIVKSENTKNNLFRVPVDQGRINAAKVELDTAKAELATANTQLDTANTEVTQQTQKVNNAQNDLDLANQKVTTTETALTQARSDYQKTVSEIASSYQDKYQNAVDRLTNPPADADMAQLKADVTNAKTDMEMAFAVEADLLSQNGVMTPTEQTNLVSVARAKSDSATDSAYKRMDVKLLDQKMSKLMTIGNINQTFGGVLQSMVQNLSGSISADATRQGAETTKYEEMLDQTKDLFDQAGDLISQAIQLYQSVIQMENQSMRDAIQA